MHLLHLLIQQTPPTPEAGQDLDGLLDRAVNAFGTGDIVAGVIAVIAMLGIIITTVIKARKPKGPQP